MSKHVSYILNLSESFNAGNYMYYFLPGITSGSILLFDQLTKKQFPTNETTQEKELNEKVWKLKNHWDFYKLNPNNTTFSLKINIVLDSNLWLFTGFGEYSRFLFVKLYTIKQLFDQLFTKQELKQISFQYFVLKNEQIDIEETLFFIDDHEGILENSNSVSFGEIDTSTITWPSCIEFKEYIANEYPVKGKNTEDLLDETLQKKIDKDLAKIIKIFHSKMSSKSDTQKYKAFLENRTLYLQKLFAENITRVADINNTEKKRQLIKRFFKTFSSSNYLRSTKDLLFRFSIDLSNSISKLKGLEQLTALLVESVNFFNQESAVDFLSGRSNGVIRMDVKNIEFDENVKTSLFQNYLNLSKEETSIDNLYKEERKVKQYEFNTQINPEQLYKISDEKLDKFISVNYSNKNLGFFYSKEMIQRQKKALLANTIDEIEDEIQIQATRVNEMIQLEGHDDMGSTTKDMTFKQIEQKLQQLKEEEKQDKVLSDVDFDSYKKTKEKYEEDISFHRQDYINELSLLPKQISILYFFVAALPLLFLYFSPVYYFKYWQNALFYNLIFLVFIVLTGVGAWFYFKSKINKKFKRISYQNEVLYLSFSTYVNSLKELAVSIRKSGLRRMNIEELRKIYKDFKKQENQIQIYKDFYTDIVSQIRNNGFEMTDNRDVVQKPDYQLPPTQDYRIKYRHATPKFTIKIGESTRIFPEDNKEFISILGVIKSIELN